MEDERNTWCFACGPNNPIGLKLRFSEEGDKYVARFTAGPEHQGYDGIVHGGIVSTLLDEIMARYPYAKGENTVTARLEIRYRQPTPVGKELTVTGWIASKRGRIYETAGTVALEDGTVTAEGKATVMVMRK
ncbi:MAG: PaaI family thioesterase [Sporomusaceae bacterium]|nr:PaaI family thioesterase [Sporomusaceae bacterium]